MFLIFNLLLLSVLDRLENIRNAEGLNKGQFEKALGKSSGYLKILRDKGGLPGADVFIKISENFRDYDLNWLMTGVGSMKKDVNQNLHPSKEDQEEYELQKKTTLLDVRDDLKADVYNVNQNLKTLINGFTKNSESWSNAFMQVLQNQLKIIQVTEQIDPKKLMSTTKNLDAFLEENKKGH